MQCQDCDAKDQITIAGKTFCANCGTPADGKTATVTAPVSAQAANPAPSLAAVPIAAVDPTAPPADVIATSSQTNSDTSLASELTNTLRNTSSQPVITPAPAQSTTGATAPVPAAQSTNANTPQPLVNSTPQTGVTTPVAPAVVPANVNSEFSSLDSKDEQVFSDEQLQSLSNTASALPPSAMITPSQSPQSAPPPQLSVKPMHDISAAARPQAVPTTIAANNPADFTIGHSSVPQTLQAPATSPTPTSVSPNPVLAPHPNVMPAPQRAVDGANGQAIANPPRQATQEANTLLAQVDAAPVSKSTNATKDVKSPKKIGGKIASVSLSLAGIALLGVYVWQINYPNLALKVASSKAGISASLPSYMPNGWKISGDIQANPGSIGYEIKSADGAKTVAINEVRSDWDSQALAENYLATKTNKYTTLQAEGLTIYMYNNNQASWINHGTWYRIEGNNHGLSQDQIIKMATSL